MSDVIRQGPFGRAGATRRRWHKPAAVVSALALSATALTGCGEEETNATVLRFMGPADGVDQYTAAAQKCSEQSNGEYTIEYDVSAKQTDDQRLQLARRIVGGDDSFDIMGMDVTWTPEFAEAGWAVPLPDDLAADVRDGTMSGPLETASWNDTLYAAPLNTNTQLMWYRKSLMPQGPDGQPLPPQTWEEIAQLGADLADAGKPSYAGVQAAQYEGIVVWFNSLIESAGGSIVDEDGRTVTIGEGDAAEKALTAMREIATAKGHDPSTSQLDENQARLAFDRGDAFMQVNYPFVYAGVKGKAEEGNAQAQEVFDDLGWTVYPGVNKGEPSKVTIGGLNIAVPSTSKHQDLAFKAIKCLRNADNQLNNALTGGLPPTLTSLYTNPTAEFEQEYPFYREIFESLNKLDPSELGEEEKALLPNPRRVGVAVRAQSPAYQSISILLASRLSPPADIKPDELVGVLSDEITRAVDSEGLVP
ncbi:extracellular solute-binding protein [Corynebacterium sp. TAE3-ERU12]|uniref:extracellular solute-binding protein n=1 Tax=Corynebacterium sp. TAE3-ERU12 TaxID=2849491 RepID=UPI001C46B06E|nr:extracellular solute-binding protein [Corynebacterium sp. TAE3-ERU12]MBV7295012.1 extracellular solute-binding protein [Corynebacterium sp. TAE3-ERU12]